MQILARNGNCLGVGLDVDLEKYVLGLGLEKKSLGLGLEKFSCPWPWP